MGRDIQRRYRGRHHKDFQFGGICRKEHEQLSCYKAVTVYACERLRRPTTFLAVLIIGSYTGFLKSVF